MHCKICKKAGKEHIVNEDEMCSTLLKVHAFFDSDGKRHLHDGNLTTSRYTCSNGHVWVVTLKKQKCWCGWPDDGPFVHQKEE